MNSALIYNYLFSNISSGENITIKVLGTSMLPTISSGDIVTVCSYTSYSIGDILVFVYKGELLIHRLVKVKNNRFFCKGDNSFRLEDLPKENVVGKVILLNNLEPPSFSDDNSALSYFVNREFRKCGYDIEKTKKSGIYRFYYQNVWNIEDKALKYRLHKETPNIVVRSLLHDADISIIQRSQEDLLLKKMEEFCDFNMLLCCFSEPYCMKSDEIYYKLRSFLTKGILNKYIEVI